MKNEKLLKNRYGIWGRHCLSFFELGVTTEIPYMRNTELRLSQKSEKVTIKSQKVKMCDDNGIILLINSMFFSLRFARIAYVEFVVNASRTL